MIHSALFFHFIKKIGLDVRKSSFRFILTFLIVVIVIGTLGSFILERSSNPDFNSLWKSFWYVFVTITTVGYGDMFPKSYFGQAFAMFIMLSGIGLLGFITATLATSLSDLNRKERMGLMQIREKNHHVICGWNSSMVHAIIAEILAKDSKAMIVLVTDAFGQMPIDNSNVSFVSGTPTQREVLFRANIAAAHAAYVLPESQGDPKSDSISFKVCELIKRHAPKTRICVVVVDKENEDDFSGCARIIASEMIANLMVQSVDDIGSEKIAQQLFSNRIGKTISSVYIDDDLAGKTYDWFKKLYFIFDDFDPIGFRRGSEVTLSPAKKDFVLEEGDSIFVVTGQSEKSIKDLLKRFLTEESRGGK